MKIFNDSLLVSRGCNYDVVDTHEADIYEEAMQVMCVHYLVMKKHTRLPRGCHLCAETTKRKMIVPSF